MTRDLLDEIKTKWMTGELRSGSPVSVGEHLRPLVEAGSSRKQAHREEPTDAWAARLAQELLLADDSTTEGSIVRLVGEVERLRAENVRLRALLDEAEGIVRDYSPGHTVWLDAVAAERKP